MSRKDELARMIEKSSWIDVLEALVALAKDDRRDDLIEPLTQAGVIAAEYVDLGTTVSIVLSDHVTQD